MTIWLRIPVAIRAVAVGFGASLLGTVPWALLVTANTRRLPSVPWAAPVMAIILLGWWLYFAKGRGWPQGTAHARRFSGRANALRDDLWAPALGTGTLGLVALLLFQGVLGRLVTLPPQQDLDPSQYPILTVFAWTVTGAVVAGVVEETAFRGYIQGGIELRHGLLPAIVVTASVFFLSHFTHPETGIVLLPFYLGAATVYGLLAAATNSIYPSMVLHAGGNLFSAFSLFSQGRSEWNLTTAPAPTIWQAGVDASFLANLAMFVVVGVVTAFAYSRLFRAARAAGRETA